jgi:hypothetical protein
MQAARQIYPDIAIEMSRPRAKKAAQNVRQFDFPKFMLILAVIGLSAFTRVYQQALVAQNGIEIERIKSDIREEARIGKTLKVQNMLLKSSSRLENLAYNKLDMVKPAKVTYIVLPAEIAAKPKTIKKEGKRLGGVLARISFLVK